MLPSVTPAATTAASCSISRKSIWWSEPASCTARSAAIFPHRAANSRISWRNWLESFLCGMARPALELQQTSWAIFSLPCYQTPSQLANRDLASPTGANLYNRDGLPASPFRSDDW